ncbi:MAG: MFS transporter [Gordonia sp. (in: high G+C Gram-positive bacteria)]
MSVPHLTRRTIGGYAAGSVGTGGFGVLPGLVLAYYLTDTLAVPAVLAAIVVVIPKAIDVVINPWIGARSDAARQATGRRTSLMRLGALTIVPLFVLTFCTPVAAGPALGAAWVLLAFSLTAVAYACFQVPYIALPAELTSDYHERTRLVSARIVVLAVTILVVGAGAPAIRDALGGGPLGYAVMAVVAAALIGGGMWISTQIAGRAASEPEDGSPDQPGNHSPGRRASAFAALRSNRHYRILLAVYVIQALASAVMLAGAQYLATYVLDDKTALTPLFVALVAPALIVMPVWTRLARRIGKLWSLVAASTCFVVGAVGLGGAIAAPGAWVFALVALCGVGYSGMQTFPLAMLPDVIDEHARATGSEQGGALSGLWTAGETVGLALGPGVFLLVLAASGFVSSSSGETAAQPHSAEVGIAAGFSLLPAALVAVSLLLLFRYEKDARR